MTDQSSSSTIKPFNAVLEGGGSWGIAHVGAYTALYEEGYRAQRLAGTSAGAIVAGLITAGYEDPKELGRLVKGAFAAHASAMTLLRETLEIPVHLMCAYGLWSTKYLQRWLRDTLRKKRENKDERDELKFGDLHDIGTEKAKSEETQYRLQTVASDITRGRRVVWPRDAVKYGLKPDDMSVAEALVMSMTIPLTFEAYRFEYKEGSETLTNLMVDGGLLSNYPIDLFEGDDDPRCPTFGFRFTPSGSLLRHDTSDLSLYMQAISLTIIGGRAAMDAERDLGAHKAARTIDISPGEISPLKFDLTPEESEALFQAGYTAAKKFLKEGNFETY